MTWKRVGLTLAVVALAPLLMRCGTIPVNAVFTGSTSAGGNTFAAASSFCTTAPAYAWMTGFESGAVSAAGSGLFDAVNTAGGSVIADPTMARSGNYSLKITDTTNAAGSSVDSPVINTTKMTVRFAFQLASLPPTASNLVDVVNVGGIEYDDVTHKLQTYLNTGAYQLSATTVSAGRWYVIDMDMDTSGSSQTLDWRIDGVAQTRATRSLDVTGMWTLRIGGDDDSEILTAWFDDFAVTTNTTDYPLRDGRINALVPNSYITKTDPSSYLKDTLTANPVGSNSWQLIDDVPMTSTTDYVRQTTGSATNYFAEFGFDDVTRTGCINGVSAVAAYHSAGTTANSLKTAVWDNTPTAAEHIVTNNGDSVATTSLQYRSKIVPPNSGTWTATKLTNATVKLGYFRVGGSVPKWDALMLEYDQAPNPDTAYPAVVNADSPASYWRLGEANGAATAAAAAGATTGTYVGSPALGNGGAVGDSNGRPYFNATTNKITTADIYDFPVKASFSIELWMKPTPITGHDTMPISKNSGSGSWFFYQVDNGGNPAQVGGYREKDDGTVDESATSTNVLLPTRWYHVVMTYDGTNIRLYVNGVLNQTTPSAVTFGGNGENMTIGAHPTAVDDGYAGGIDEVAIYNTALDPTRILAHYNAGKP